MNLTFAFIFSFQSLISLSFEENSKNPLGAFDSLWSKTSYNYCNTAEKTKYLKQNEQEVIFILNLVRQFPQVFNNTVVAKWPAYKKRPDLAKNTYYTSLVKKLQDMKPLPILQPDSLCWVSAQCHAFSSGKDGYVGHDRIITACEKVSRFYGECCQYGYTNALDIVMSLLIDEDVPSLGHRTICLGPSYTLVGISHQPHKEYRFNTVLDFYY